MYRLSFWYLTIMRKKTLTILPLSISLSGSFSSTSSLHPSWRKSFSVRSGLKTNTRSWETDEQEDLISEKWQAAVREMSKTDTKTTHDRDRSTSPCLQSWRSMAGALMSIGNDSREPGETTSSRPEWEKSRTTFKRLCYCRASATMLTMSMTVLTLSKDKIEI